MFLYFYEAELIVGFNPCFTDSPYLKICDDFDMGNPKEDDHLFNRWEKEENEDGTFYLVFVYGTTRYYLSDDGWTEHTKMYENSILGLRFVQEFENRDTITIPINGHILQPVKIHDEHYMVCMPDRGGKSNVRLTTCSNMDNSYVLK
jgi:hypothetical protein